MSEIIPPDKAADVIELALKKLEKGSATDPQVDTSAVLPDPLRSTALPSKAYPVDSLGTLLGGAAKAIHDCIQVPMPVAAQCVLGVASLSVQGHYGVVVDGREQPCSLQLLSILESGDRKSTADKAAAKALNDVVRQDLQDFKPIQRKYAREQKRYTKKYNAIVNNDKLTDDEQEVQIAQLNKPPQPIGPLRTVANITIEGLFRFFQENSPSAGLFTDEGGLFTGGHAMNKDNRKRTLSSLTILWDGGALDSVRKGLPGEECAVRLYDRLLTTHLMAQPIVAAEFFSDPLLQEQGYAARCLIVYPDSLAGARPLVRLNVHNDPAMRAYHSRVTVMARTPAKLRNSTSSSTDLVAQNSQPQTPAEAPDVAFEADPIMLPLSPEALAIYEAYYNLIDKEERLPIGGDAGGKYHSLRKYSSRSAAQALRIACVLQMFEHFTDNEPPIEISAMYMQYGVDLAQWYLDEILRITSELTVPPETVLAEKLLEFAQRQDAGMVCVNQIQTSGPNPLRRNRDLMFKIADLLVQTGHFERNERGTEVDGKKRYFSWRLASSVEAVSSESSIRNDIDIRDIRDIQGGAKVTDSENNSKNSKNIDPTNIQTSNENPKTVNSPDAIRCTEGNHTVDDKLWSAIASVVPLDDVRSTVAEIRSPDGFADLTRDEQRYEIVMAAHRAGTAPRDLPVPKSDCSTCRHQIRKASNPVGGLTTCAIRDDVEPQFPKIGRPCCVWEGSK